MYFEPPLNAIPGEHVTFQISQGPGIVEPLASRKCNIYDLRGQENATHIDTTGFQTLTIPSSFSYDFFINATSDEIKSLYYPEAEKLLLENTGANRVFIFDHGVRRPPSTVQEGVEPRQIGKPHNAVHADQTPTQAHRRVARHILPHTQQPCKRFQIINVWRPILNTVYDWPLALCEAGSVDVDDLVPAVVRDTVRHPPPHSYAEAYYVKYNPNHRWWFWSEMTPNDVIMFKCYDSASRALTHVKECKAEVLESELQDVAGLIPHTAFFDEEGSKKSSEQRYSVEIRALVLYD